MLNYSSTAAIFLLFCSAISRDGREVNMVVYRELSSLCHDLGYSARALYTLSNSVAEHYHDVMIPKANGEQRLLHVPDKFMKSVQKSIARNLLAYEEISPYAMAYRPCGSTRANARPHVGAPMVMKLDVRKFFDHITYPMVKEKVFSSEKYSESNRVLLSVLCVYSHTTPQGAPTSPAISNIILRDFDNRVGDWCDKRNISYTRYCDDLTFSGEFNPSEVKAFVKEELFKEGFFLNSKKTVVLRNGQRKEITGIVVNEKTSVPAEYKKRIRQELFYCQKYGIDEHVKRLGLCESGESYARKLLGRINYVLSVELDNEEMKRGRTNLLLRL